MICDDIRSNFFFTGRLWSNLQLFGGKSSMNCYDVSEKEMNTKHSFLKGDLKINIFQP